METTDVQRLKSIKQALFSIAHGNFDSRIARTEADDIIESIVVLINMMAEEMKETLLLYADLHTNTNNTEHIHMVFILDQNFKIRYVTSDVLAELGYETNDLLRKSFSTLLSNSHLGLWRSIGSQMIYSEEYNKQHRLIFRCKNKLERFYTCGITSIYDVASTSQYIMVSAYEPILKSKILEDSVPQNHKLTNSHKSKAPPNVLLRQKDRRVLQNIQQYILKNLDKALPHLKILAHNFGTNEFKLKYGFKQLYGTTVFRFLKQERMKKGRLLIENTNLPIKTIAKMCGYTNGSHFSRDFRECFSLSPRKVRGGVIEDTTVGDTTALGRTA